MVNMPMLGRYVDPVCVDQSCRLCQAFPTLARRWHVCREAGVLKSKKAVLLSQSALPISPLNIVRNIVSYFVTVPMVVRKTFSPTFNLTHLEASPVINFSLPSSDMVDIN